MSVELARGNCDGPGGRNITEAHPTAQSRGQRLIFSCPGRYREENQTCNPLPGETGGPVDCFVATWYRELLEGRNANLEPKRSVITTTGRTIGIDSRIPHAASVDKELRPLTDMSYSTLEALVQGHGEDVSFADIYRKTHPDSASIPHIINTTIGVQISRLRQKLGDKNYIESVSAYGYRIATPLIEPGQDGEQRPSAQTVQTETARISVDEKLRNKIWVNGELKKVTPDIYKFITALMKKGGDYISYEDLHFELHPDDVNLPGGYLHNLIQIALKTKKSLGNLDVFENVRENGYRMTVPITDSGRDTELQPSVITVQTQLGTVVLYENKHIVTLNGTPIHLQPKEFNYLTAFLKHPDTVLTFEQLYLLAHPTEFVTPADVNKKVRANVTIINRKFGHTRERRFIKNKFTEGYILVTNTEDEAETDDQ